MADAPDGGKALVFISCGQVRDEEIELGKALARMVNEIDGLTAHFAQNQTSFEGVSKNIFAAIDRCVAFVAVMHYRGDVTFPGAKHAQLKQFAEYIGTSPSNIANMISGYKGQQLPEGWVAYQTSEAGKWFIPKMNESPDGDLAVPDNVTNAAYKYVIGTGMRVRAGEAKRRACLVADCAERALAKRVCSFHYYQARRRPELLKEWERQALEANGNQNVAARGNADKL